MYRGYFKLIIFGLLSIDIVLCDELVQVNMLMRHGIRSPYVCYPNDPYLDFWKSWSIGELTPLGMKGMFELGVNLRRRYIETLKFVGSNYLKSDIYVRSADEARCIQSVSSFLAGFYANSQGTYPNDTVGWPGNWSPVPIHTAPNKDDKLLAVDADCPRDDEIYIERAENPKFKEWEKNNSDFYAKIINNSGIAHSEETLRLFGLFDCIRIEKKYKFKLPDWIDDQTYSQCIQISDISEDYIFGGDNFGLSQSHEMTRLRVGNLLKQMIDNMNDAIKGVRDTAKIYVYSAHDYTLASLLRLFECKRQLLGYKTPDFASNIVLELWKTGSGSYNVQAYYHPDNMYGAINFSQFITGCPPSDSCPFDTFVGRSKSYLPDDIYLECLPKL